MLGKAVGVHEHHRDSFDAIGFCALKRGSCCLEIGFSLDRAIGADAFINFDNALIKYVGFDDLASKNFRTGLVTDLQRIAEALADQEEGTLALPSSSALVATVVPIFTAPIRPGGIASPVFSPSKSRMPCTAASE
jgi:hypothetical protein